MNKKELMEINEEFLNLFNEPNKKSSKKIKSKKNMKKDNKDEIKKETIKNNFKDNIIVFIEPSEIVDIQKLLVIVDKIKRKN